MFSDIFPSVGPLEYPPFYGWLPLPSEWSASSFASAARRKNILVTPPVASSVDETDPERSAFAWAG